MVQQWKRCWACTLRQRRNYRGTGARLHTNLSLERIKPTSGIVSDGEHTPEAYEQFPIERAHSRPKRHEYIYFATLLAVPEAPPGANIAPVLQGRPDRQLWSFAVARVRQFHRSSRIRGEASDIPCGKGSSLPDGPARRCRWRDGSFLCKFL